MQSELAAVNALLTSIGDTPINSLDIVHSDVETAKTILDTVNTDLQSEGWYFNTESWDFNLDTDGKQPLPTNTLYVNTTNPNWIRRGSYLYNLESHTYDFASESLDGLTYSIVSKLPLSDLPHLAYSVIVNRAKVQYITELEADATKVQILLRLVDNQYIQLKKHDLKFTESSAFSSPMATKLLLGTPYYRR